MEVGEEVFFAQYLGSFENTADSKIKYHKFIRRYNKSKSILEYRVYDFNIKALHGDTSIELLDEEVFLHEKGKSELYESLSEKLRRAGL